MRSVIAATMILLAASGQSLANGGNGPEGEGAPITVELSGKDKEEIITGVVEYFKRNPSELVEAIVSWRQRAADATTPGMDPITGNPTGDVTVMEFVDHGCAPCRESSRLLAKAAKADGQVRIVHKEFPVAGPASVEAAMHVLASVHAGGSWSAAASSLAAAARLDAGAISEAIKASGAETASREALSSARRAIEANRQLASRLGIRALPALALISGDKIQILTGPLTESDITDSVRKIRQAAQKR